MLSPVHSSSESNKHTRMILVGASKTTIRVGRFDVWRGRMSVEYVADVEFLRMWQEMIGLA